MSTNQQRIVFGYNRNPSNNIELHEMQAQVVRLIFMCYADGNSLRQIKATLEGGGIISPQNNRLSPTSWLTISMPEMIHTLP